MKIIIHICICIYILIILQKEHTNSFEWNSVLSHFKQICEIEGDCDTFSDNSNESNIRAKNVCCKGCLCQNCEKKPNPQKMYSGLTRCLKPFEDKNDDKKYRFVVHEPLNGCTNGKTISRVKPTCNEDIKAAPWGNFYPVYSVSKKANFKNEQCAVCHGSTNNIKWDVYALFWGEESNKVFILRNYYRNFNSTDMMLAFYSPNLESRGYEHVCYTLIDECYISKLDTFFIPTFVNVSRTQIIQACEQGITSPFQFDADNVYKNVFCAICNDRASESSDSLECEEIPFIPGDDVKSSGKTFASLLDHVFVESESNDKSHVKNTPLACMRKGDTVVKSHCREVICPALQVRLKDGTCGFPMEKIFTSKLNIDLKLTVSKIIETKLFQNMSKTELETAFKSKMPWPGNWELISVYHRKDTLHANFTEMLVSVGYRNFNSVNIKSLVSLIEVALSRVWVVDIGEICAFKQSFHIHGLLGKTTKVPGVDVYMEPLWAKRKNIHDMFLNLSSPSWNILFTNALNFYFKPPGFSLEITSLFFCDQVELSAAEFVGTTKAFPLYLKHMKTILYPSQYDMYLGSNGSHIVNICIEDSGFVLNECNYFGSNKALSFAIVCFVCFVYNELNSEEVRQ